MRVYNLLQLTMEQKEQLARRWRSWCRRRASLSRHLAVALKDLEDLLPIPGSISTDFLRSIDHECGPRCVLFYFIFICLFACGLGCSLFIPMCHVHAVAVYSVLSLNRCLRCPLHDVLRFVLDHATLTMTVGVSHGGSVASAA